MLLNNYMIHYCSVHLHFLQHQKYFADEITSQIHDQIFIHFYSKKIVFVYLKKIDHHLVG